jgi:hypothetical protein
MDIKISFRNGEKRIKVENKVLLKLPLEVGKYENVKPKLSNDILVYRSPKKLEWLRDQEKKYGKMGEI